jgi:hypothetical protein
MERMRYAFLWAGLMVSCMPSLESAVARGQARLVRACGLEAATHSVRWVRGYFACGAVESAVGCANVTTRDVLISTRTPDLDLTVTHELLHLLGATHVPAGRGIMAASASAAVNRITAADLVGVQCLRVRVE